MNYELQNKIPQVRFPEFKDEWEVKRLGDLVDRITTKNKENNSNVCTISAQYGLISQLEYFNKSVSAKNITGYYLLNKNDFAYNKSYSKGYPMGAIKRLNKYEKGVVSTLYICFRNRKELDNSFAEQYYETGNQNKEIQKVAQEGARNHGLLNIGLNDFFSISICFPHLKEQQKIAHFFSTIDQKINQLQEKKNALEAYKKGLMQQIFSQKLRFKDDASTSLSTGNGKDYPDWEVKKLGEVGETYNGLSGKTKEDFGVGKPYIQYKQIFDNSIIEIDNFGLVNIKEKDKQNKAIYGDVFFTVSSETPKEIGMSSVLRDTIDELYLNSFCFGFRPKSLDILIPDFSRYLFRSEIMRKEIIKLAQGSTRYNMSKIQFVKIKFSLPCYKEQSKIANFLSKIDEKIENVNQQIAKTKEWKKGLLQKMFV